MKKSLFARMLLVYLLIIVMSFALLGGIFFGTLRSNYLDVQMDTMIENANVINSWATDHYHNQITSDQFQNLLTQKAESEGTVIWLIYRERLLVDRIADPENKSDIDASVLSESVKEFCRQTSDGQNVKRVSDVDRSFRTTVISVAIPLMVDNVNIGTIVVHREVGDFGVGLSTLTKQVFFPLAIAVAFALILVLILSRYVVKPIKEISLRSRRAVARGTMIGG